MYFELDLVGHSWDENFYTLDGLEIYKRPQINDICKDKRFFDIVYLKEIRI